MQDTVVMKMPLYFLRSGRQCYTIVELVLIVQGA